VALASDDAFPILIATEIGSVIFPLDQINRRLSIKNLWFFPTERAYRCFDFMAKA